VHSRLNPTFNIRVMTETTEMCGQCGYYTKHDEHGCVWHQKTLTTSDYTKHDEHGCVWHQKTLTTPDGETYQRYDEFNQDGEEW